MIPPASSAFDLYFGRTILPILAPQAQITRAEVAAMAVNYQPENLEGLNRDNPFRV